MKIDLKWLQKTVHWIFAVVIVLHIITGYGITKSQLIEKLTFGILTKALSFKLHIALSIPVIILLILHIYIALMSHKKNKI